MVAAVWLLLGVSIAVKQQGGKRGVSDDGRTNGGRT